MSKEAEMAIHGIFDSEKLIGLVKSKADLEARVNEKTIFTPEAVENYIKSLSPEYLKEVNKKYKKEDFPVLLRKWYGNCTPLEVAIRNNHLQAVKTLSKLCKQFLYQPILTNSKVNFIDSKDEDLVLFLLNNHKLDDDLIKEISSVNEKLFEIVLNKGLLKDVKLDLDDIFLSLELAKYIVSNKLIEVDQGTKYDILYELADRYSNHEGENEAETLKYLSKNGYDLNYRPKRPAAEYILDIILDEKQYHKKTYEDELVKYLIKNGIKSSFEGEYYKLDKGKIIFFNPEQ